MEIMYINLFHRPLSWFLQIVKLTGCHVQLMYEYVRKNVDEGNATNITDR